MNKLREYITNVPNYPKEGITFKDITTLLEDKEAFQETITIMKQKIETFQFDTIAAIDSRGFIFGAPLAYALNKRLVIIRKKGKLPRKTIDMGYSLEYGEDQLSLHEDSLSEKNNVVLVDDLLATGGTMDAAFKLIESTGANIQTLLVLIELNFLKGREKLPKNKVTAILEEI